MPTYGASGYLEPDQQGPDVERAERRLLVELGRVPQQLEPVPRGQGERQTDDGGGDAAAEGHRAE